MIKLFDVKRYKTLVLKTRSFDQQRGYISMSQNELNELRKLHTQLENQIQFENRARFLVFVESFLDIEISTTTLELCVLVLNNDMIQLTDLTHNEMVNGKITEYSLAEDAKLVSKTINQLTIDCQSYNKMTSTEQKKIDFDFIMSRHYDVLANIHLK